MRALSDHTVIRDPAIAEVIRQREEADARRAEERERLKRLIESIENPAGRYRSRRHVGDDPTTGAQPQS